MTMRESTVGVTLERSGARASGVAPRCKKRRAHGSVMTMRESTNSLEPLRGASAPSNSGGGGVPAAMKEVGSPRAVEDASGVGVGPHAVRKDETIGLP